ncbi:MAG: putative Ig domain-containing protein [Gemmatimonadota bacterium]|nr:putative Ig domain-containing protein [Gemmatimonadota bacterium]
MTHIKLLRQHLAYVPWLLAASLVLGWSGAAAQDLKLSVNPESVREDAGATDIAVTAEVTGGRAMEGDTYVLLSVSHEGLNSRFYMRLTALRIPAGEKRATATITLIPINDDVVNGDLPIVIRGNVGGGREVEPTTIALVDDDKDSKNIKLSVDIAELNRFDDATDIVVTATLDGKVLRRATSFALTIGDHPDLESDPNADTNSDGNIDSADATKDNREAERDLDYTVALATLTIPRNAVSGTATITITPKNQLPGTIRVASPDNDAAVPGIQIGDGGLTLSPVDIKIKKEVVATADAITLSQERIREDAGETTIELKVTLTDALVEDETVKLVILSEGAVLPSGDIVVGTPTRDVHYRLIFGPPFTIPAGASEGTTTFTLTPINDTAVVSHGPIYIQVTIGNVSAAATIAIADDDANSMNISLTANPATISERAGQTAVAVTGTLDGKVFDDDVLLLLTIDPDPKDTDANGAVVDVAEATRDIDYSAVLGPLTIPAGSLSGTTTITIIPVDDGSVEGDEKIRLTVPYANNQITAHAEDGDVKVTVGMVDITLKDPGESGEPFFSADASIADQTYTVGTAIADLVLPEAAGGDGELTYSISALPAGLVFDSTTRTLSGTPTEATNGAVAIAYTATDDDDDTALLTFTITSAEEGAALAFSAGASIADQTYTVGTAIADLVLPEAAGGAGDLRYRVLPLPAGLAFDSAMRTLSGTPTEGADCPVKVIYMVTDSNRDAAELTFSITVNTIELPPVVAAELTAEPAVIREDAEATTVSLTFTLKAASATDESVGFAIVAPSDGTAAVRDVDYTAVLEGLITIPAGATEGIATLILAPVNDDTEEGLKALAVQATLVSTGETLLTDIEIRDDETPSTSISLSADPSTLSENAALTTVTVTATLDGKALAEDATVHLVIDDASTATRDLDYAALFTPIIEIPAGSITGTVDFYVDPRADNLEEGDEIIRLIGTIDGLAGDEVEIALNDPAAAKAVVQTRPEAFSLANNFPNPFNPATTIQYALPTAADVELTVYNAVGQPVRTLVAEHQSAGRYAVEWDATNDSGHRLSSGMYFYRLQAGGEFREVKKMLLLK